MRVYEYAQKRDARRLIELNLDELPDTKPTAEQVREEKGTLLDRHAAWEAHVDSTIQRVILVVVRRITQCATGACLLNGLTGERCEDYEKAEPEIGGLPGRHLPHLGSGGIGQGEVVAHVDVTADDPDRLAAREFFNQPQPARLGLFPCGEPQLKAILLVQLGGSLFHHRRFHVLDIHRVCRPDRGEHLIRQHPRGRCLEHRHDGDHNSQAAERIETKLLPFFSRVLRFGAQSG